MPGFKISGNNDGQSNLAETTRKHRFRVSIFGLLPIELLFFAYRFTLPSAEIDRITLHHKQEEIYLPGKHRYKPAEIAFYRVHDLGGDLAAREIRKWWSESLLIVKQSKIGSDDRGNYLKKYGEVDMLDGMGNSIYKYKLHGIFPQLMTPDPANASDSGISSITISLSVDKVEELDVDQSAIELFKEQCEDGGRGAPVAAQNQAPQTFNRILI